MRRVNPRRKPATQADVKRAKEEAMQIAIRTAMAVFFTVMRDKEGYDVRRLMRLWDEVNALSDSVTRGYVSIDDLCDTLREESNIII